MAAMSTVVKVEWSPSSTPLSGSPTWVDITDRVRSLRINRGRDGIFDLYSTGKCTVELNNRDASIDLSDFRRWRQFRVTAVGPNVQIFTGFIAKVTHDQSRAPKDATANLLCQDPFGLFGRYELSGGPQAASTAQALVTSFLSTIGYTPALVTVGLGGDGATVGKHVPIQAETDLTGNAFEYLQSVMETEGGALYCNAAGSVVLYDRHAPLVRLAAGSSLTFSDTPTGGQYAYLAGSLLFAAPDDDYRNRVVAQGSGVAQVSSDITSGFPPDTLSRTSLLTGYDNWAKANAEQWLGVYKQTNAYPRRLRIHLHPNGASGVITAVTALDLTSYVTVTVTPTGDTQRSYKCFVENIEHDITPDLWNTTLGFSSADRWQTAWGISTDYLKLDDATYGVLNTGKAAP